MKSESDGEDSVGLLSGDEKGQTRPNPLRKTFAHPTRRKSLCLALVAIALILLALALPAKKIAGIELPFRPATPAPGAKQQDRFLHVVIPHLWSQPESLDLCRTLLTASTLHYPSPVTLSWNSTFDAAGHLVTPTVTKLKRVSKWLNGMPKERENDIVAVLANKQSWFQVRPEVLLKRYLRILEEGNKELHRHVPTDVTKSRNMGEKVVFATQNDCPSRNETSCRALAAAAGTSVHYLSPDFAIGPLKHMKPLWRHAASRATQMAVKNVTLSEHSVFASLLIDQHRYRQKFRQQERVPDLLAAKEPMQDFGIALDSRGELSYAAPRNVEGIEWVKHLPSNKPEARKQIAPLNLNLAADIAASAPPFWTLDGAGVPLNKTWHDVQLLTNTTANIIPAIVQRGPTATPTLATTWWRKMWFQTYARQLLDTFVLTPIVPVAILTHENGDETRYWGRHWQKMGVMPAEDMKFKKWNAICNTRTMADALFVDRLGPWVDPTP